jgi:hypothetical protein
MNRKQRRAKRKMRVGTAITTTTFVLVRADGSRALVWCVRPDGMSEQEAFET